MLKIGKLTDYGILVLDALAQVGAVKQSTEELAMATGLTVSTLRKVMKTLVDAGLVIARRGAHGGYKLARSPQQIRILDVVEAFEGPVALTECSQSASDCEIQSSCSLVSGWMGVNELLMQILSRVTLEDVRQQTLSQHLPSTLLDANQRIRLINL
jgi:FeS assembly SUF system regulator